MYARVIASILCLTPVLGASLLNQPVSPRIDCILGCQPGQLINSAKVNRINNALDSIMKGLMNKKAAIGFGNEGGSRLINPSWYVHKGQIHSAAPYEVPTGKSTLLLFQKKWMTYGTSKGLMSYEVEGTGKRVVVLFDVDTDSANDTLSHNIFALRVYDASAKVNKDMYNHMLDYSSPVEAAEVLRVRTDYGLVIQYGMTQNFEAKVIVHINSEGFDENLGPDALNYGCDKDGWGIGSKTCWKESPDSATRYFTDVKCSNDEECVNI